MMQLHFLYLFSHSYQDLLQSFALEYIHAVMWGASSVIFHMSFSQCKFLCCSLERCFCSSHIKVSFLPEICFSHPNFSSGILRTYHDHVYHRYISNFSCRSSWWLDTSVASVMYLSLWSIFFWPSLSEFLTYLLMVSLEMTRSLTKTVSSLKNDMKSFRHGSRWLLLRN